MEHQGKKECNYHGNQEFLIPMEYDKIYKIGEDIWVCSKEDELTAVKTE